MPHVHEVCESKRDETSIIFTYDAWLYILLRERRIERLRHMEMKILTERVVFLTSEIERLRHEK